MNSTVCRSPRLVREAKFPRLLRACVEHRTRLYCSQVPISPNDPMNRFFWNKVEGRGYLCTGDDNPDKVENGAATYSKSIYRLSDLPDRLSSPGVLYRTRPYITEHHIVSLLFLPGLMSSDKRCLRLCGIQDLYSLSDSVDIDIITF